MFPRVKNIWKKYVSWTKVYLFSTRMTKEIVLFYITTASEIFFFCRKYSWTVTWFWVPIFERRGWGADFTRPISFSSPASQLFWLICNGSSDYLLSSWAWMTVNWNISNGLFGCVIKCILFVKSGYFLCRLLPQATSKSSMFCWT